MGKEVSGQCDLRSDEGGVGGQPLTSQFIIH